MGGRGQNFTLKRDEKAKNVDNTEIVIPKGTKFSNIILIAGRKEQETGWHYGKTKQAIQSKW